MTTRGILNQNPGNIRWHDEWQGLVPVDKRTDEDFCQFVAPEWGIRAMAKILSSYSAMGLMTLRETIHRWAPPSENDTDSYLEDVCQRTGIDPDGCIALTSYITCKSVIKAIIFHENGQQPYGDDLISRGLSLAGVNP